MTAAEEIFAMLTAAAPGVPVAPVIQNMDVDPPAIVYDFAVERAITKGPSPDTVNVSVFIFNANHLDGQLLADQIRKNIRCYTSAGITYTDYTGQDQQFTDPWYVTTQLYELKILNP